MPLFFPDFGGKIVAHLSVDFFYFILFIFWGYFHGYSFVPVHVCGCHLLNSLDQIWLGVRWVGGWLSET